MINKEVPVTQVAKGIFKIGPLDTGHDSGPTSPFLVVGKERAMVVEPGQDGQVPRLVEAINKRLNVDLDRVAYVWASHIHIYHCQGVSVLLKELPKAKFLVHRRYVPHVIDTSRLMESTAQVWGVESPQDVAAGVKRCYGPMRRVPEDRVMPVDDGQVFDLGGKELENVYTPGHAPHHMCLFDRQTRALWVGDLTGSGAGGPGQERGRPEILPPLFDCEKERESLRRIRALKASVFLTHSSGKLENYETEKMVEWAEEDHLAYERICLEGMREKVSYAELSRRIEEYCKSVGIPMGEETQRVGVSGGGGAPFGLLAYLKRQHPELEIPASASTRMRQ